MTHRLTVGNFALFAFWFVALFIRSIRAEDPDFGWHIRVGEYILRYGIPYTDPFSYTMPQYLFVDHEWLADTILAYFNAPMILLHGIFSLLTLLTAYILWYPTRQKGASILIFLLLGTLFEFIGIRMQIITWFFFACLSSIIAHEYLFRKYRYFIPFLFLLWANLHGGFAIGYVIFSIFLLGRWIEKRRVSLGEFLLLVICGFVTLINPYGIRLWDEVSKSFTDTSLRWTIQEWYPAIYFTNIAFWIYALVSWMLMIRYWKRFSYSQKAIAILLFASGMASMRNIPLYVIGTFFTTVQAVRCFATDAARYPFGKERFSKASVFFFGMALCLFVPQMGMYFYGSYIQDKQGSMYPYEAVGFLKHNIPRGNIFAAYDIGGFLLWQLPEKKVFIDGRMPSWRHETASQTESAYAFGEYRAILSNKVSFLHVSNKYDIDTVIVPVSELVKKKVIILGMDAERYPLLRKLFVRDLSFAYIVPQLHRAGWREIYRDTKVVIFQNEL